MKDENDKSSAPSGMVQQPCSVADWKSIAEWLYDILDDIDSVDDMAKDNNGLYRKTVGGLQRLKAEVGNSYDGQTVIFTPPKQKYGFTRLFSQND